jgi:hypothetical protein
MAYQPSLSDLPEETEYQPSLGDIQEGSSDQSSLNTYMGQIGYPTTIQTSDLFKGIGAGLLDLGRGLANLLPHAEDVLGIPETYKPFTAQQVGETQLLSPNPSQEAQIGYLGGQLLPAFALPETEGGVIARAAKGFGTSEALSPVYEPDKPIPQALQEGLLPSAGGALIEPAVKGLKLVPEQLMTMGGTATPEEFTKNVSAIGNKPVGTPELAKAPVATKFEQNWLGNFPLSGVQANNLEIGKQLDLETGDVLKNLNQVPESKPVMRYTVNPATGQYEEPMAVKKQTQQEKIAENFQKNVEKNEAKKRELYQIRDDTAKETEGSFTANTRKAIADKHLEAIQAERDEKGFTSVSPETLKELKSASNNNPISFQRLNFNSKTYDDLSNQFARNGNLYESKIMGALGNAYNEDIKNAISKTGNEKLKIAQQNADFHFKDKIAPIRNDDALYQQAKGFGNPNRFLTDVISNGRYDDPTTLDIVMKNLDPDYRKQFAHEFLTQGSKEILGTDELGSDKVLSTYGKLGDESKRLMFNQENRTQLDKAYKTRQLMGQSINSMLNPKTGYSHGAAIGLGTSAALTHGLAGQLMNMGMPMPLAYTASLGALTGTGNMLSKYLTSETSRKLYPMGKKLKATDLKSPINIGLLLQANEDNQ